MSTSPKPKVMDADVVSILRQEFIDGASFPADIFTRLAPNKYVLLARQGDKANFTELSVQETVEHFYVLRNDYKKLVGQKLSIAGILVEQNEVAAEKQAVFLAQAAEAVFTELSQLGVSEESIDHARTVAHNISVLVSSKPDLLHVLTTMASLPGGQMNNAIAVSAVSVMIGRQMGWTVPATLEKVAMGALLRDVGLNEIPKELLEKQRHEFSLEDRVIYETHPFRGAEILRSMPSTSDEIISIVYEHHETANGQGYPRRLRDLRMNPLAKVVCLADLFCDLTIKGANKPKPKTPREAIQYLDVTLGQPYNKQAFQALKNLVGVLS